MAEEKTILAVDDDLTNLELIDEFLGDEGFKLIRATNGFEALEQLEKHHEGIKAILLDWMMPKMNGLECLRKIKTQQKFQNIPIIMQTARAKNEDIAAGINEGAYYYLTKPFEDDLLLSIINAAIFDYEQYLHLTKKLSGSEITNTLICDGTFRFKTIEEAYSLSQWLGQCCGKPGDASVGLAELMINAIEHGNLGISYDEKTSFINDNTLKHEVKKRLLNLENKDKYVEVKFEKNDEETRFSIVDQGEGFNFEKYLTVDHERAFDNHGRGIAMAKMLYFDDLNYVGKGNHVEAVIRNSTAD